MTGKAPKKGTKSGRPKNSKDKIEIWKEFMDKIGKDEVANIFKKMVDDGNEDFIDTIEEIIKKKYPFSVHQINGLIRYLNHNKESIVTWQDPNYYGSFTETYCQQLVKSYFGNVRRCFCKITFIKMLQANCLVVY
ncbi:hypothetical protein II941_03220 [bacterium]|nr:hypothetical protein [bacterium]